MAKKPKTPTRQEVDDDLARSLKAFGMDERAAESTHDKAMRVMAEFCHANRRGIRREELGPLIGLKETRTRYVIRELVLAGRVLRVSYGVYLPNVSAPEDE